MSMGVSEAMKQAISSVMDMMFFLPVQISNNRCDLPAWFSTEQPLVSATLGFNGPVSGISYLLMPDGLASEITANFLGLDQEQINEKHKGDTVKEALNMIVGKMLSELDKEGVFRLGIPELIPPGEPTLNRLADLQGELILVETEENRLAAGIAFNSERKAD